MVLKYKHANAIVVVYRILKLGINDVVNHHDLSHNEISETLH